MGKKEKLIPTPNEHNFEVDLLWDEIRETQEIQWTDSLCATIKHLEARLGRALNPAERLRVLKKFKSQFTHLMKSYVRLEKDLVRAFLPTEEANRRR